jgi:lipooligosaccharide transport system permease protein
MTQVATPARAGAATPAQAGTQGYPVRQFRFWMTNYRRTWKGTIYSSLLNPVLYLGAMGVGLGSLVDARGTAALGGVSYLTFLAPGLLAGAAMQTAMGESSYPVFGSVKWLKTYQAATATPLRPADLLYGHLLFTIFRLATTSAVFLAVVAAFGAAKSLWSIAALPAAVLTGLAFAAPIEAYAMTCRKETSFALIFRFGIIPLFLFSGTFFPVSQLPAAVRPLAYLTPLWHGVALCRSLTLGTAQLGPSAVHVAYLLAVTAAGIYLGRRTYQRRLYA